MRLFDNGENKITRKTYDSLQIQLADLTNKGKQYALSLALSGAHFHETFAVEDASRNAAVLSRQAQDIKRVLDNAQIIEPRGNTSDIGVGNRANIFIDPPGANESYVILGPRDAGNGTGWISFRSPLGSALLGMKNGEEKELKTPGGKVRVRITDIFSGDF